MKIQTKIVAVLVFLLVFISCKKKYTMDYIGPQASEEESFQVLDSLTANINNIDFSLLPAVPVFFRAKFDKSITWKLTITGDSSGAVKTFIGTSQTIDSLSSRWYGNQDSLFYFSKETCTVTLSDYYPTDNNVVYNGIVNTSVITPPAIKVVLTKRITLVNPKFFTPNIEFPLFISKINTNGYTAGYDPESDFCSTIHNQEASPELIDQAGNVLMVSNTYLPFSKNGKPINRLSRNRITNVASSAYTNNYFILKGTDSFNHDYYIGRIENQVGTSKNSTLALFFNYMQSHPTLSPDSVWFNVFVYGTGDNSKLNYTIKQDDNQNGTFDVNSPDCNTLNYTGTGDNAFESAITLNFTGWKLFSLNYKGDFTPVVDGKNGNGNLIRNPSKIWSIQFSLVAPNPGASAQAIFDYPVMTIGGPLKY